MWATQVTITLPGRAVTATLAPSALPRYLLARGWSEFVLARQRGIRVFSKGQQGVAVADASHEDAFDRNAAAIVHIAALEDRRPLDVLADLLPSTDGPALQWEHMSTTARVSTLDAIATLARVSRVDAAARRAVGNTESALAADGRAMGMEAAAAMLRGQPR